MHTRLDDMGTVCYWTSKSEHKRPDLYDQRLNCSRVVWLAAGREARFRELDARATRHFVWKKPSFPHPDLGIHGLQDLSNNQGLLR